MAEKHSAQKQYYYNYVLQASECYGAARMLELNPSTDEKDKLLDELIVRRLRGLADRLLGQAMNGFDLIRKEGMTEQEKAEVMKLLAENHS